MSVLIVLICIFNILMWILFYKNFKNLFTTDDIIENTKSELDKVISDVNRNVDRNITLIDDYIARLRSLNAEAEKKIKMLNDMELKEQGLSKLKSNISSARSSYAKKVSDAYSRGKRGEAVVLTKKGEEEILKNEQKTLFDESEKSDIQPVVEVTFTDSGASYAEIPVISSRIVDSFSDKLPTAKNDLKSNIINLFERGLSIDEIANKLNCSTTEVQFALTIENKI